MRNVARPRQILTAEQKKLLAGVRKAFDARDEAYQKADELAWKLVQEARDADIYDSVIARETGVNRTTITRKLGPQDEKPQAD